MSLAGWTFSDGIRFTFPANAVIPSHGFLVVARNVTNLLANYPNLSSANTVGNYGGALSDRGERLTLSMPALPVSADGTVPPENAVELWEPMPESECVFRVLLPEEYQAPTAEMLAA